MRRFVTGLVFLFFFFFFRTPVEAGIGYATRCLNIATYYPPSCPSEQKEKCINQPPPFYPDPSAKDHTVKIEGSGFPVGKEIYIVGCVTTSSGGWVCTGRTGDSELNAKIKSLGFDVVNNPSVNGKPYQFVIRGEDNPVRTTNGKVEVIVRSRTSGALAHSFFGVYEIAGEGIPREKTVQFGDLVFSQDPKQCISIRWDPTGRVFDAVSLEPLPEARVKILDEFGNLLPSAPGFNPDQLTGPDGIFSFQVPEGKYKLQVEKAGYSFPVDINEIDPNFSKAYWCDPEIGSELYNDQYTIEEKGKLIHCDVPLKPTGKPYTSDVVIYDFGHMLLDGTPKVIKYTARFSHPYALGILKVEGSGKVIKKAQADKYGDWEVFVPVKEVPGNKDLILEGRKQSLSTVKSISWVEKVKVFIGSLVNKVFAQDGSYYRKTVRFEPIPPYVEGYVYDEKGKALPGATVKIVSRSTGNVLLQVKSDENGFIKILPEYLSKFSYYFQVQDQSTGKIISYTTSQFVRSNKKYYSDKQLDLIQMKKGGEPIVFSKAEKKDFEDKYLVKERIEPTTTSQKIQISETPQIKQPQSSKKLLWALLAVLTVFMVSTIVIIIFYIRSQKFRQS